MGNNPSCIRKLKSKAFHSNCKRLFTVLARVFFSSLIVLWIVCVLIIPDNVDLSEFISQIILVVLIVVWLIGIPWLYQNLEDLDDCFGSDIDCEVYEVYKDYKNFWAEQVAEKKHQSIYSFSTIVFRKHNITSIFYYGIWGVWIIAGAILLKDIIAAWNLILLIFYAILSAFSSLHSVIFICFLYRLSKSARSIYYNKYCPSTSYIYQRLNNIIKLSSKTYLIIVFTLTISYVVCIVPNINIQVIGLQTTIQIFSFIVLLGWGTLLIVHFFPRHYLKKILLTWSFESINMFEQKISQNNNNAQLVNQYLQYINRISKDIKGEVPIFEIIISAMTLLVNVCGLIISLNN